MMLVELISLIFSSSHPLNIENANFHYFEKNAKNKKDMFCKTKNLFTFEFYKKKKFKETKKNLFISF